ncbi:VOC family protein [Bacillus wiedmannii]
MSDLNKSIDFYQNVLDIKLVNRKGKKEFSII